MSGSVGKLGRISAGISSRTPVSQNFDRSLAAIWDQI